jgi:hypothetical protein
LAGENPAAFAAKWTGELDVVTMQRELGAEALPEPPVAGM